MNKIKNILLHIVRFVGFLSAWSVSTLILYGIITVIYIFLSMIISALSHILFNNGRDVLLFTQNLLNNPTFNIVMGRICAFIGIFISAIMCYSKYIDPIIEKFNVKDE